MVNAALRLKRLPTPGVAALSMMVSITFGSLVQPMWPPLLDLWKFVQVLGGRSLPIPGLGNALVKLSEIL